MRTWIKGGVLVAAIYLLVQLIDDFLIVFYSITPFEKVRYLLYFDFFNTTSIINKCGGWFELCGILYIAILGFIVGAIIGGIIGMFNKEGRRREILREMEVIKKGRVREIPRKEEEKKRWLKEREERKRLLEEEEEKKARLQEEEVPEIEIIPLKSIDRKKLANSKSREKRRKNKIQ